MTQVSFTLTRPFSCDAEQVWSALVDWPGHAAWVPMTRVEVHVAPAGEPFDAPGRTPTVGEEFTATTGAGPLALRDRMRVTAAEVTAARRTVRLEKVGPVLTGWAELVVEPAGPRACTLHWSEQVRVPYLPGPLAGVVGAGSRLGFAAALRRLDTQLRTAQRRA